MEDKDYFDDAPLVPLTLDNFKDDYKNDEGPLVPLDLEKLKNYNGKICPVCGTEYEEENIFCTREKCASDGESAELIYAWKCKDCGADLAENITRLGAIKHCPNCGAKLAEKQAEAIKKNAAEPSKEENPGRYCKKCNKKYTGGEERCPKCGTAYKEYKNGEYNKYCPECGETTIFADKKPPNTEPKPNIKQDSTQKVSKWPVIITAALLLCIGVIIYISSGADNEKAESNSVKLTKGDVKKGPLIGTGTGLVAGTALGNYYDKLTKELAAIADVEKTDNGVKITLKGDILFAPGKTDLNDASIKTLTGLNKVLKKYPKNRIVIHGYTDSTGSAKTNEALSHARAQAVYNYLVNQNGLKTISVIYVGHGSSNAIGDNKTEAGRAKNRRVELQITANERDL